MPENVKGNKFYPPQYSLRLGYVVSPALVGYACMIEKIFHNVQPIAMQKARKVEKIISINGTYPSITKHDESFESRGSAFCICRGLFVIYPKIVDGHSASSYN